MAQRDEVTAMLTASGPFELAEDTSLGYPIRIWKNAPRSMREVFQSTAAHADRDFLIYENEVLTYADFHRQVANLAHKLVELGVQKGDRVAVGMRNYPEWVVAFWACQTVGAIVVAINAWWITPELEFAVQDSTPKVLLLDGERYERMLPILEGSSVEAVIVTRRGGAPAGGIEWADAVAGPDRPLPDVDVEPTDLSTILYTSGTTGRPKGAVASHRNHVTNLTNTAFGGARARAMLGDAAPPQPPPQGGVLQTFPFFHIGGLTGLYVSTAFGSKMALMYKWVPSEGVDLVEKHRLTGTSGVPIVMRQLLETARDSGRDISSLLSVAAGGAPVPPDLIKRIENQFQAKTSAGNGYGLTETTSAVISNGGPEYFAHPDSVGRPTITADVRVVDDDGKDVTPGSIGEIWIRGPNVIVGYWGNPEATEASFGGGWFRTGDLGYIDAEGLTYVVDRKKDVIIRGGENVYCAEVEAAILAQPKVKDATVIGLPHPDWGEEVAAIVQVSPADQYSGMGADLTEALSASLARFKIPSVWKITDEDLPRTATGKVLKRELRDQLARERAT